MLTRLFLSVLAMVSVSSVSLADKGEGDLPALLESEVQPAQPQGLRVLPAGRGIGLFAGPKPTKKEMQAWLRKTQFEGCNPEVGAKIRSQAWVASLTNVIPPPPARKKGVDPTVVNNQLSIGAHLGLNAEEQRQYLALMKERSETREELLKNCYRELAKLPEPYPENTIKDWIEKVRIADLDAERALVAELRKLLTEEQLTEIVRAGMLLLSFAKNPLAIEVLDLNDEQVSLLVETQTLIQAEATSDALRNYDPKDPKTYPASLKMRTKALNSLNRKQFKFMFRVQRTLKKGETLEDFFARTPDDYKKLLAEELHHFREFAANSKSTESASQP